MGCKGVSCARNMITAKREKDELYIIPILIFIKVKSNKGRKDGCAKTYWLQSFFFWLHLLNE